MRGVERSLEGFRGGGIQYASPMTRPKRWVYCTMVRDRHISPPARIARNVLSEKKLNIPYHIIKLELTNDCSFCMQF